MNDQKTEVKRTEERCRAGRQCAGRSVVTKFSRNEISRIFFLFCEIFPLLLSNFVFRDLAKTLFRDHPSWAWLFYVEFLLTGCMVSHTLNIYIPTQREGMGLLKYQAMPSLRDIAHDQRWASTLANRSNARHRSNIRAPQCPLPPDICIQIVIICAARGAESDS